MKTVFCAINARFVHSSLAAYTLRAYVGHPQITALEYSINDPAGNVLRDLVGQRADVYLFSAYIFNVDYVQRVMSDLKKVLPDCCIVVGGPEVTVETAAFMQNNSAVDVVVKGEGELTLKHVLKALEDGRVLREVANVAYRQGGTIVQTAQKAAFVCMDEIPFPYSEEDIKKLENKIVYYESSRGCPYRCAYCLAAVDRTVREKDIEKVQKELAFFIAHRVAIVKFTDRTFNCNAERANSIWRYIKENNIATTFHFEIAADLLDEGQIALLKQMPRGSIQLEAGIQSANVKTLDAVGRKSDLGKSARNLKKVVENRNIHVHTDLIAGLPYEDYETFKESFRFAYDIGADMLQLGFLKILKGSPMAGRVEKDQYVYSSYAPYEVLSNKWLSYTELLKIKVIESVVDKYVNGQGFSATLAYIIPTWYAGDSFAFFEALAQYFEDAGYFSVQQAKAQLYKILFHFLKMKGACDEYVRTLLAYDGFLMGINPIVEELKSIRHNKFDLIDLIKKNDILIEKYEKYSGKKIVKMIDSYVFNINPKTFEKKRTAAIRIREEQTARKEFQNLRLPLRVYLFDF